MTRDEARQRELQLLVALGKNAEEREEIDIQLRETRGFLKGWDEAVKPVEAKAPKGKTPPAGEADQTGGA